MKSAFLLIAVNLGLAACATPTPYQPFRLYRAGGVHGGYFEDRLGPNHFLVRFHGNSMTSREGVEQALLYRAAKLSLQNGFDHFVIVGPTTTQNVRMIVEQDPGPARRSHMAIGGRNGAIMNAEGAGATEKFRPIPSPCAAWRPSRRVPRSSWKILRSKRAHAMHASSSQGSDPQLTRYSARPFGRVPQRGVTIR